MFSCGRLKNMDYEKNSRLEYPADVAGETPLFRSMPMDHIMNVSAFKSAWATDKADQAGSAANSAAISAS